MAQKPYPSNMVWRQRADDVGEDQIDETGVSAVFHSSGFRNAHFGISTSSESHGDAHLDIFYRDRQTKTGAGEIKQASFDGAGCFSDAHIPIPEDVLGGLVRRLQEEAEKANKKIDEVSIDLNSEDQTLLREACRASDIHVKAKGVWVEDFANHGLY